LKVRALEEFSGGSAPEYKIGRQPLHIMQKGEIISAIVADDSRNTAQLISLALDSMGVEVNLVASDGREAVEGYKDLMEGGRCPDVALLDYRMPRMDGVSAAESILRLDPGARVVIVSADEEIEDRALGAGANAFVAKPFDLEDLREAVLGGESAASGGRRGNRGG
jgi:two-component system chemotaxis response regulator CheY